MPGNPSKRNLSKHVVHVITTHEQATSNQLAHTAFDYGLHHCCGARPQ